VIGPEKRAGRDCNWVVDEAAATGAAMGKIVSREGPAVDIDDEELTEDDKTVGG